MCRKIYHSSEKKILFFIQSHKFFQIHKLIFSCIFFQREHSNDHEIVLHNVSVVATEGIYKCQVSGEGPLFATEVHSKKLRVAGKVIQYNTDRGSHFVCRINFSEKIPLLWDIISRLGSTPTAFISSTCNIILTTECALYCTWIYS